MKENNMEINISGIFIDDKVNLEDSELRDELDKRYGEMMLFLNKTSTSKIATAYQGEKNRYSVFWNHFDNSTFVVAELHPKQEIIEKLSKGHRLLTFRISDEKGIYIIALYQDGILKRRKIWCDPSFGLYNHFMKTYSEIGQPLNCEIESDGRQSVLGVIKSEFNNSIDEFPDNTKFNRLTFKADKAKMKEWLKENG